MEIFVNFIIPLLVIAAVSGLYVWFLISRRKRNDADQNQEPHASILPKSAPVVPYMESISLNFFQALKQALPEKYIIYVNVPIEKLFDQARRDDLHMVGQYADFVIFTPNLMPVLVIDLFDLSIINLDRVNRIKNVSKEILRNSGIPVLDYQYTDNCNIDELRRRIANLLNPLSAK
ncbi:MAG: DUF2726 domain-containing protein [Clostridia bacterium]|nr:DUF2726 domain-containing protein [Clostridia bacterium]